MTPKEISRRASAIFRSAIPTLWAIRDQQDQEDYGIDYEMELMTESDVPTGILFKVQQKGQLVLTVDGTDVKLYGFDLRKLRYLLHLRLPAILVAVDITAEHVYWTAVQGNRAIVDSVADAERTGQATVTVRLPQQNALPATAAALLDTVDHTMEFILVRSLTELQSHRVAHIAREHMDVSQVSRQFRAHSDFLRCSELDALLQTGSKEQVETMAMRILDSESESPGMRFAAGLYVIQIVRSSVGERSGGDDENRCIQVRLEITSRMLRLARENRNDGRLRAFARFQARAARLQRAVAEDFALFVSSQMLRGNTDFISTYAMSVTERRRRYVAMEVLRQFHRIQQTFNRIVEGDHSDLLPQAWATLVVEITRFIVRLRQDGLNASALVQHLDAIGDIAIKVTRQFEQWQEMYFCATQHVMLGVGDQASMEIRLRHARELADSMPGDYSLRATLCADLEDLRREFLEGGPKTTTFDEETTYIESMARAMGINLDDPDDMIANVVRIGLRDRNPERVLRTCQHLYLRLGSYGLPGRMLGLPTAGSKHIFCAKFGFGMGSLSLDQAFALFAAEHCEKCTEKHPHAPEWKWTPNWQQDQDRIHGQRFPPLA